MSLSPDTLAINSTAITAFRGTDTIKSSLIPSRFPHSVGPLYISHIPIEVTQRGTLGLGIGSRSRQETVSRRPKQSASGQRRRGKAITSVNEPFEQERARNRSSPSDKIRKKLANIRCLILQFSLRCTLPRKRIYESIGQIPVFTSRRRQLLRSQV